MIRDPNEERGKCTSIREKSYGREETDCSNGSEAKGNRPVRALMATNWLKSNKQKKLKPVKKGI